MLIALRRTIVYPQGKRTSPSGKDAAQRLLYLLYRNPLKDVLGEKPRSLTALQCIRQSATANWQENHRSNRHTPHRYGNCTRYFPLLPLF
jgi:hypothetical protein